MRDFIDDWKRIDGSQWHKHGFLPSRLTPDQHAIAAAEIKAIPEYSYCSTKLSSLHTAERADFPRCHVEVQTSYFLVDVVQRQFSHGAYYVVESFCEVRPVSVRLAIRLGHLRC